MLPINDNEVKIDLTAAAFEQIVLISANDYTLEGLYFRLKIDGKGCNGFTYATGFSEKLADDKGLTYLYKSRSIEIVVDPFTLHYCKEGTLDHFFIPQHDDEGFSFTNKNEEKYHGKFFKDETMVPPTKEDS